MRRFIPFTVGFAICLVTQLVHADFTIFGLDAGIQPRVQGGVVHYEYEQDNVGIQTPADAAFTALTGSVQGDANILSIQNVSSKKFKVKGAMPTLNGGVTFFVDRFFVDVFGQKSFNITDGGRQNIGSSVSLVDPIASAGVSGQLSTNANFGAKFDREDFAVSFGFQVTDNIVLYSGYKYAETKFRSDVAGNVIFDIINVNVDGAPDNAQRAESSFTGDTDLTFRQDGPFVGLTYGLPINQGFFDGVISANLAVAFLEGRVNQTNKNFVFVDSTTGISNPGVGNNSSFKGDSVGLTLGLTWKGSTSVPGLSYVIGINGYQYDFDANNNEDPDFKEFSIGFNTGFSYAI